MTVTQKKDFVIQVIFILTVVGVAYFCLRYLTVWFAPFLIGWFIAFLLKPACMYLTKVTHIKRKGAAAFVTTLFYLVVGLVIWLLGILIIGQFSSLLQVLPNVYDQSIQPFFGRLNESISSLFLHLSPATANYVYQLFDSISTSFGDMISSLSTMMVGGVAKVAQKIPLYCITVLFSILSSILISVDYTRVTRFIMRQFPDKVRKTLVDCKNFLIGTVFKMIRAYAIILGITFVEIAVGLFFLKVDYFLPIAALIAVLDILPLIGTGGILVPWGVFQLISGNYFLGIGILVLYGIITLVRSILEPKIVGDQIGLNPIVTITAMYLGLRLFGFIGLLLAPLTALTVKYLNDDGKIRIYR